ncbi:alpha/beta hydrolase [Flavobacterium agrisoli]|uniref:BD-FAE-like domain-containing protein n=1 Tax=Flavobacterium agrisoli TaxID=2793066 RepID=A0A934PHR9_9FLAO|nr:hypothetical protein [Flavobacterium agrisoli]MBK0368336.1 hypothetical protein [Flavobacterium agrisoli]
MFKNINFRLLFLISGMTICCFSCNQIKKNVIIPPTVKMNGITFSNVNYKKIASNDSLVMDIYLPIGVSKSLRPAVLFIHGGGWTGGDKSVIKTFLGNMFSMTFWREDTL